MGYEAQLWQMADALRGSMDAAEYKHVRLGLLLLKYISDAFEEKRAALLAEKAQGADPEDPDEYRAIEAAQVIEELIGLAKEMREICPDRGPTSQTRSPIRLRGVQPTTAFGRLPPSTADPNLGGVASSAVG